ncbi:MAG: EamA family transporter [Erysipelotrichaceae bacterium]|nr:EamA family transporter [Erysipelotrichaceae bacterium]
MKDKNLSSGIILVAISAASFAFLPIFARIAYEAGTSTYSLLFLRFLVATVFMFSLMLIQKKALPSKKDMLCYVILGAAGYVGQSFCYFTALNYASAGVVSLLLYTYPALVMIGSVVLFHEKVTVSKVVSLVLALIGAGVIIGGEIHADSMGILLSVMAAVFYAAYILISSRVVKPGEGMQSSAFIMLGAAMVYGVFTLVSGFTPPVQTSGIIAVILIALVSTAIAFWTFFAGMEKTGPSVASLVSTLEPVVTVLASAVILSEKLTVNVILGGIFVIAALLITAIPAKE